MTTTSGRRGSTTSVTTATPVAQARIIADVTQRWLAVLGTALCALQIAFAGYGFWGSATSGGNEAAGRAAFEPHAIDGQVLQVIALVLLLAGIISRANKKAWIIPLVLAVLLWAVQGMLVGLGFGVSTLYGALHAFDGTVISAGFLWLAYDRWQHRLGR